jgi:hypothetical protein
VKEVNKRLSMALALVLILIFPAASIYAWQTANKPPETAQAEFRVVVNGGREITVTVPVNMVDGLTREEAEQIAGETFVQVLGDKVIRRLDNLTLGEASIKAHYTWGYDESDMGHVYDMTADLNTLLINVTHCR